MDSVTSARANKKKTAEFESERALKKRRTINLHIKMPRK